MKHHVSQFRAFLRDERGSLTIEFVLWVPLLGFWFALSCATFDAYKSRNEAAKAANTIADIITREQQVTDDFLDDIYALEQRLLPRVPAGHELRVTSILFQDDAYSVHWSSVRGPGTQQPMTSEQLENLTVPTMADGDSIILVEINVPWEPILSVVVLERRSWSFDIVARPRFVDAIPNVSLMN